MAPLAGYTDQAFRKICKSWQVDYLVSEMVSADGLSRDSLKTARYALFSECERPFVVQIFGSDPFVMAKAAEYLLDLKPDMIDINMGCPVKKVVKRGAGSALMKDAALAQSIVKEVKSALAGQIPLSVKFRSGWNLESLNYLDFGQKMQEAGADLICLHPRTQSQGFGGISNWEHIRQLKKVLSIPLIGNGDIDSPRSAQNMLKDTGCDALMIGRGALGKPWIFRQIKEYLATGLYQEITTAEILTTAIKHLEYALELKPEYVVVREMRSQLCHYTKGLAGSAALRNKLNRCESAQHTRELLQEFFALASIRGAQSGFSNR